MKKLETAPHLKSGWGGILNQLSGLSIMLKQSGHGESGDEDADWEQLLALVEKCNQEYYYWDKVKYQALPNQIQSHEELWAILKSFRAFSSKKLRFGRYEFSYGMTPFIQELLHTFDLELGGKFGGNSVLPEQDRNQYLISSIMEEAIASSQIEGAVTTRKVAKDMLRKNQLPKDKSQQMIVNNYETIKYLAEIKNQDMTPELLCEIQRRITHHALDNAEYSGKFRDSDDISVVNSLDGEIVHIPPKADEVPILIRELCDFFNQDNLTGSFIHPIVKACILHFMIAYVHPFVDGNGRTARTVFYWYLLKKRYWLVEFLSISRIIAQSKNTYYRAFQYTETDDNDLTYFIYYQIITLKKAVDSLQEYIAEKVKEQRQVIDFQKIGSINQRQASILGELQRNPDWGFNVKEIENTYAVSNQTARNDINGLIRLGYIEVVKVNAKEQKYFKSPRFDEQLKAFKSQSL
jgi:Fic family protein